MVRTSDCHSEIQVGSTPISAAINLVTMMIFKRVISNKIDTKYIFGSSKGRIRNFEFLDGSSNLPPKTGSNLKGTT
jgi:hypothetical protein